MKIVIIGAGVVGFHLARELSAGGYDITVVDSDPALVRRIEERMDVLAISGDASCPSVLDRAGIHDADLAIAVTDSDTTNLVVSLVASKAGARKTIVRVRNPEFSCNDAMVGPAEVGADRFINPIEITARTLERLVRNPGATDFAAFGDGDLFLWGFIVHPQSPLAGVQLKELRKQYMPQLEALIVAIRRPDGSIVIPTGDDELLAGDNIYVFIRRKATGEFRRLVHPQDEGVERVAIFGATQLGIEVARRLETRVKQVILVDEDQAAAEAASKALKKTLVLCGDVVDPDFQEEYGLADLDNFVALTDEDQTNLMNSLLVKKRGARRVSVLVQYPEYLPVLQSLGVDIVANPRLLTVSSILTHIRRGRIMQVARIGETGAEAREYVASQGGALVGKPLKDVGMPKDAIVGAIFREGSFQIARGDSVVEPGDHVVILALPNAVDKVEKLFTKKSIFNR